MGAQNVPDAFVTNSFGPKPEHSTQTHSQIAWTVVQYRVNSKECCFDRPASHRTHFAKRNVVSIDQRRTGRIWPKGATKLNELDIDLGRQASSESTETPFGPFYLVKLPKRFETTFVDVFVSATQKTLQN